MKIKLLSIAAYTVALFINMSAVAQAPTLGTAANFALFSSNGAVSNTGLSHLTGNVGTNNGSSTAFGNVDGVMNDQNLVSAAAAADLTLAYNQLLATTPTHFPSSLLGGGQTLGAGVYSINATASLDGILTLDALNDPNAVFIFKINGAFSSSANSQVALANGALACNVFWKIEGLVDLATNTSFKGNIIANNAAIITNTGVVIEGRALSTTGAVTIAGSTVRIPLGCGSPELTGPAAPALLSVACFTIFSGNGSVVNTGNSYITGDVGTNVGLTQGFQEANVDGTVHPSPNVATAQCAADLGTVYQYLNTLPTDINLLYPAELGNNLVLTPHTYQLTGATVLTGTIFLNAQDNPDAVFVIKINGALSTSTYAMVVLMNEAQAKNVYWKVDGATDISDYSEFKGTIVGNNGAINLSLGVQLDGRALTTDGAFNTAGITATMTPGCGDLALNTAEMQNAAVFYPNPFSSELTLSIPEGGQHELYIYSVTGAVILHKKITSTDTHLNVDFPAGMYFYKLASDNGNVASGKLMAK